MFRSPAYRHNALDQTRKLSKPGGTLIFFVRGRTIEQGYHFQDSDSGTGYHLCKNLLHDRVHMGSMWSFLTPKSHSTPLALREYDLNRLYGNISTFSDRFLTNFQDETQFVSSQETQGQGIV